MLIAVFSLEVVSAADFKDIQDQIDSGSTNINIGTNTYTPVILDTVNVNKDNVVIRGSSSTNKAILDGQGSNSRIMRITGDNVRLENIIFRNADVDNYGGAIRAYGVKLTLINCEFINNKAATGVHLEITADNFLIQNCIFRNNNADYVLPNGGGAGGAIDSHASNGRIIGCTFISNSAVKGGGALYFNLGTNNTISGCTFKDNSAPKGGAIWVTQTSSTLTIRSSNFTNNKATNIGGAICADNTLNIISVNFTGNNAKTNGGAIYTTGNSRSTISNSNFISNSAKNGGGIYNNAPLAISKTHFKSNKASSNGGAIYAAKNMNISRGSIKGNIATSGSGVFNLATLSIFRVGYSNNLAKFHQLILKTPVKVNPSKKFYIYVILRTEDNIHSFVNNKKGTTTINNVRKTPLINATYKSFSSFIDGKNKTTIKPNKSTGIAKRSILTKKSIKVTVSYSQSGKTWSITKTVKVGNVAKVTYKDSTKKKPNSSKNVSSSKPVIKLTTSNNKLNDVCKYFKNHENTHLSGLVSNLDNYKITSKKISYWNIKKNSDVVTAYIYKVDSNGWYSGALNSKNEVTWGSKLSKVPTTSGTWFTLNHNPSTRKYSIGNKVAKHTNSSSGTQRFFFVHSKISVNHKSLTPYIGYTYVLTNKKTGAKKTVEFFEKSDTSIYFKVDESSKNLKDYKDYLVNSKKAPTNNKAITSLTKSIISKISGELTPTKKATALFNWVRNNIAYPPKSRFYECTKKMATGTLSSREANCVDQSNLLISMLRTAKIPSQYIHYKNCTFYSSGSIYGHVWVSAFVGKWIESDTVSRYNSFGNITNFKRNPNSKHGPHIKIDI